MQFTLCDVCVCVCPLWHLNTAKLMTHSDSKKLCAAHRKSLVIFTACISNIFVCMFSLFLAVSPVHYVV